jgi:hypothetical protein
VRLPVQLFYQRVNPGNSCEVLLPDSWNFANL